MSLTIAVRPAQMRQAAEVHASLRPRRHFALFEKVLTVAVSCYFVASVLSLLA